MEDKNEEGKFVESTKKKEIEEIKGVHSNEKKIVEPEIKMDKKIKNKEKDILSNISKEEEKDDKQLRKEVKKQQKQEKQKKFLSKKHKSPEDLEYEKMFEENHKILINFLGDSITEGLKWQKKEIFCFYLSKWLNIKVNNQGYHATRIARQDDDDKDFNYRLKDLNEKADFTFIFGGTNDYGMGDAEIGDINSDSYYTFYGAVKNLVKDLLIKFSKDKICFILPLSRYDEDKIITHGPLSKYRDVIKEICDLNHIDYLDLCQELPIPSNDGKTEYFKDGLHPNKQGHKIIARNIIKYLKNKGIINKNFEFKE